MQITLSTFRKYMESLVKNSPFVDVLLGTINEEVANYLDSSYANEKPFITLFHYKEGLSGNASSTDLIADVGLSFVQPRKSEVYEDIEFQKSEMMRLAKIFAARMNLDAKLEHQLLYNSFDKSSVTVEPVEFEKPQILIGCVMTLELTLSIDFTVKQPDWKDPIPC